MNNLKYLVRKISINYLNYNNLSKIDLVKLYGYYNIILLACRILMNSKGTFKKTIKQIPYVNNKINTERQKIIDEIHLKFNKQLTNIKPYTLPKTGFKTNKIISILDTLNKKGDIDYKNGRVAGATYSNNEELDTMLYKVFPYFNKSNPLHTNMYPAIRKMEQECISIMIKMFNGSSKTCGSFTSGGTESILLACKTYRDLSKENGILKPEILVSSSVHCAFNKACSYFNIKMVIIPCTKNGYFDIYALKKKINKNTILIVGSTPSYNLGLIDQIVELNDIALKYRIPLHIDACIGSFLINFSDYKYDFSLSGVTSISADFHKYGQSPKGASCIMYKNKDIMKYQYFIDVNWSGGIYASTSLAGSRCGNVVALTWCTLMYFGSTGYESNYNHIITLRDYFIEKVNKIEELYIYGNPELGIIAINSKTININIIAEELNTKKWIVNIIQNPTGFQFGITSYHSKKVLDNFFKDLNSIIIDLKYNGKGSIKYSPCIYGTAQKINDSDIITDVVTDYLHVVNGAI